MKLAYPAIFEPCEEGGYSVTFPDLPGCFTEGEDIANAVYMAQEAASGWLLMVMEEGEQVPKATELLDVQVEKGCIVSLVAMDMDEYAEKYGHHSVKKTLTIPAWMNTFVEKYQISCSKLLQNAINEVMKSEVYMK